MAKHVKSDPQLDVELSEESEKKQHVPRQLPPRDPDDSSHLSDARHSRYSINPEHRRRK